MKRFPLIGALSAAFVCLATTAGAHHSFAMFDRSQTQTIAGTVKEFELISPHGWLRIMVSGANGVQSEWPLEMGGAGQLARFGWTQTSPALIPSMRLMHEVSGQVEGYAKISAFSSPFRTSSFGLKPW